jgi:hypothetical protein
MIAACMTLRVVLEREPANAVSLEMYEEQGPERLGKRPLNDSEEDGR